MLNRLMFNGGTKGQTFSVYIEEYMGMDESTGEEYAEYTGHMSSAFNGAILEIVYEGNLIFENCPNPAPTKITVDSISYALLTPKNYYKNYYSVSISGDNYLPLSDYPNQTMTFTLE